MTDELRGTLHGKLLLRMLSKMEDMRQTLHVHSSMLQSLLRAQNISGSGSAELPDGVQFPLRTFDDVDNLEARVTDVSLRSAIVSVIIIHLTLLTFSNILYF